ncbi:MAG: hypothetical protein ACI4ND_04230 [Succinivibrio sp.]
MNTSLIRVIIITLYVLMLQPCAMANSSDAVLVQMSKRLKESLEILRVWSKDNLSKSEDLSKYLSREYERDNANSEYINKEAWNEVKALNQNSLMLLEASYAFANKTKSTSEYISDSIRTKAFEECIKEEDCTFVKLNSMMDQEALELSSYAKENAQKTQQMLLENINKLNELCNESKDAPGLNSSIDTLSKVNSTQAGAMLSLTNQVSNLVRITAHDYQSRLQDHEIEKKSDELFYADSGKLKSPHLEMRLESYE